MQPKQRQQLIMYLIIGEAVTLFVLLVNGLWGALIGLLVIEALIGVIIYLRRSGRLSAGKIQLRGVGCFVAVLVLGILLLVLLGVGVPLYTDWLWFDSLGYASIFRTEIVAKVLLFLGGWLAATAFLGGNLHLALHWLPGADWVDERGSVSGIWRQRIGPVLAWIGAAVVGLGFGSFAQARWMDVLRFFNSVPLNKSDPLFGQDLGMYLFRLDTLLDLKNVLVWLVLLAVGATALVYALALRRRFPPTPLAHISVLGTFFLLVMFWEYRLKILQLVYSTNSAAYGAGYTDVHARWPAYTIISFIVLFCAVLLLVNLWRRTWRLLAAGVGLWLLSILVLGIIYPVVVQALQVRPVELDMERPYITYNIDATLAAYGLDQVESSSFPITGTLTMEDVQKDAGTISNIRLWDHRPLFSTYGQLQYLRYYYSFHDVDVERYTLGGQYREVELSVRELDVDDLHQEAQTWVNRHLVYTHGYGIVLSPVNESCAEGQPCLFLRDIPPQASYPELALQRPEIYFGETSDNYIIVGTDLQEFDYPRGDADAYTTYEGRDGVPLGGLFRRLLFALRFGDLPILVSGSIKPESRILYNRSIQERINRIAPFLWYDADPYAVILDGRVYWIQDAYTFSQRYPYSRPYDDANAPSGLNYLRASVKVVVDAYDGTTTFYIVDPADPIVQVYARIFPALFRPVEEMPAGLRAHWRYPEQAFRVQTAMYATYHMRDPRVFYNKEDSWDFARESYEGVIAPMDAYYVIMRLPDWEKEEMLLMVPFTPAGRDNMVAWMHVQCDGSDYGNIGVFKFPKDSLVYGPLQVEARMNQTPDISQQLTLWGQVGSSVIRGNLLVVPIDHNLLYVAPIYLQAETGKIPELKRVIVAYADRVVMAETLDQGLRQVLAAGPVTPPTQGRAWQEVAQSAQQHYAAAQACLQAGDWACYGTELQALEQDLQELINLTQK
jgi:uncharacterized membrane protein (UPF0182 family)